MISVVRASRKKRPPNIGRDSWVWGEQETLGKTDSPHEVGEEALTERMPLSGHSVPWNGGVMVVVVVAAVVVVVLSSLNSLAVRVPLNASKPSIGDPDPGSVAGGGWGWF